MHTEVVEEETIEKGLDEYMEEEKVNEGGSISDTSERSNEES